MASLRVLQEIVEEPRPCSYLDDRSASLEHRVLLDVTPEVLEGLLERGWRRFGPDYFRPRCAPCHECVPTRIPVATFVPSKSQRRARARCAELEIELGPPRIDRQRLSLYHAWHAGREADRGWAPSTLEPREYQLQFAFPHPSARELSFYERSGGERRLVGVGICDETPRAWSAVYFFYHPEWADRSLGVANVVAQVEIAKRRGRAHVYLGYRVDRCPSMAYKARYRPQERLVGWPADDEAPIWQVAP